MAAEIRHHSLLLGISDRAYAELTSPPNSAICVLPQHLLLTPNSRTGCIFCTYGFGVEWTMRDNDICSVGLFVDVIFVGGFYKGKVLFEDSFEVTATLVDVAD